MAEMAKSAGPSHASNGRLAHNWWAVGLRGMAALLFVVALMVLPPPTLASLVVAFAAYLAADGVFAFAAGFWRGSSREARSPLLIFEGAINIAIAGAVLAWQSVAIVPFFRVASLWAVLTGAMLLAAAHRLAHRQGRPLLLGAAATSIFWGLLVALNGPLAETTLSISTSWLVAYALLFGLTLLSLAALLRNRHLESFMTDTDKS